MLDLDPNDLLRVPDTFGSGDHIAIAATTTIKLRTIANPLRFERVEYDNPTGFATVDPANFWTLNILAGATVVATWATNATVAGVSGAIPVDTFFDLVLSATDANRVALGNPTSKIVMSIQFVKTGTPANLPIGRFFFHTLRV